MAENSEITWTHHTFNPWRGCTKVSDGCKNCYAETLSRRNPKTLGVWGPLGTREPAAETYWKLPLKWNEEAKAAGERRRVFCASLADVFEGPETCQDPAAYAVVRGGRIRLWHLIEQTPNLDWLLLTKRPENVMHSYPGPEGEVSIRMVSAKWAHTGFPKNVWIGTSVENQKTADQRIPDLLKIPAAVRFLSCEPLLGPVDLSPWIPSGAYSASFQKPQGYDKWPENRQESHLTNIARHVYMARCAIGIHWVIAGGESGGNARPAHPDWFRGLRDQCTAVGIPFHFKQWGEWGRVSDIPGDVKLHTGLPEHVFDRVPGSDPPWAPVYRVGKKNAGRLLDGREWDEFPAVVSAGAE